MHPGRELGLINKHVNNRTLMHGESVTWYEFSRMDTGYSQYDDVYDEGAPGSIGRKYKKGVVVPTIYAAEFEDMFRSVPEGLKLTQTLRLTVLFNDLIRAGLDDPGEYKKHIHDIISYDGRYYKFQTYRVYGRLRHKEVIVGIMAYEVFLDEEMVFDQAPDTNFVTDLPWPTSFPS